MLRIKEKVEEILEEPKAPEPDLQPYTNYKIKDATCKSCHS